MEYGWNKVLPSDSYEEELASLSGAGSLHSISISSPPDASIYASGGTKPGDARSVRSGRSGRSMRARYQNWADAASLVTPNGPGSSTASALNVSVGGSGHSMMSPAPSILGGQGGHSNPNDRIFINEWKAPAPPTVPSTLKEEEQLERCQKHMEHIEAELVEHNDLRTPMLQLYSMRSSNYSKALANWERKSNSLLQELVKYQCYVESLKNAVRLRAEKRDMREVDSMMRRADEEMARVREAEEGGPLRA